MPDPALQTARDAPNYKVLVAGSELSADVALSLLEVRVEIYVDSPSLFSLTFNNWKSDSQEFKQVESILALGAQVEVKAGYVDAMESLILGEVAALEPEFAADAAPKLIVRGFDVLHRLTRGKRSRAFQNMTDSEIVRQIAQGRQIAAEAEDTQIVYQHVYQNNLSDFDFLLTRASRIDFEVGVQGNKLRFRKRANDRDKSLSLDYGLTLKEFFARLSTVKQVSKVTVRGWNPETRQEIVGVAAKGDENSLMGGSTLGTEATQRAFFETEDLVLDEPLYSESEALQIARGRFNQVAASYITGEAKAIGTPALRAGVVVELKGLDSRFSGLYYVPSASHVINPSGYSTRFTLRRTAT